MPDKLIVGSATVFKGADKGRYGHPPEMDAFA